MSQSRRYVPILRTKPAEWDALRNLASDVRRAILPRFEVLAKELGLVNNEAAARLPTACQRLAMKIGRSWGSGPAFVDFSRIGPSIRSGEGEHPVALFGRSAATYGINPTLMTGPYDDLASLLEARDFSRVRKFGLAVRLHYGDVDKETVTEDIDSLLSLLQIKLTPLTPIYSLTAAS